MDTPLKAHLHPISLQRWQEGKMEYMRYKYKLMPHDIVVDLGSYRGEFADQINQNFGCRVICVEPTDNIRCLAGKEWATIIEKAAGTEVGVQRFGGLFYYTSLFEDNEKYGFRDFPTFDVNNLFHQRIGLAKINVEGAEYVLMNHIIDAGLHKNVENFQIQFHLIDQDSEKEWRSIAKKLSETHEITWRMPFCWENWQLKAEI